MTTAGRRGEPVHVWIHWPPLLPVPEHAPEPRLRDASGRL